MDTKLVSSQKRNGQQRQRRWRRWWENSMIPCFELETSCLAMGHCRSPANWAGGRHAKQHDNLSTWTKWHTPSFLRLVFLWFFFFQFLSFNDFSLIKRRLDYHQRLVVSWLFSFFHPLNSLFNLSVDFDGWQPIDGTGWDGTGLEQTITEFGRSLSSARSQRLSTKQLAPAILEKLQSWTMLEAQEKLGAV